MRNLLITLVALLFLTSCSYPAPGAKPVNSPDFTPEFPIVETLLPTLEARQSEQTQVPEFVVTPQVEDPQISPSPSPTPEAVTVPEEESFPYKIQVGTPVETANFVDPQAGCNWMGVGGQVFSGSDKPVTGMIVEIGGLLNGDPVLQLALTGDTTVLGPGGYVIKLADNPISSEGTLWVQLFDLNGIAKSEKVTINTYGGDGACEKNLIVINFNQLGPYINEYFFPSMYKNSK